jgi:hypothetical protein
MPRTSFAEAIALARQLGLDDRLEVLSERLDHIKSVYRSQFSGFDSCSGAAEAASGQPTQNSSATHDGASEQVHHIRASAALVVRACRSLSGFEFDYTHNSIQWLDGYIERIRTEPVADSVPERLISNLGSYLGQAIVSTYGGAWSQDENGWHIRFDERNRAYPFNKVAKQFPNAEEDSDASFYRAIGEIFGMPLLK